jgi:hypothetical protein
MPDPIIDPAIVSGLEQARAAVFGSTNEAMKSVTYRDLRDIAETVPLLANDFNAHELLVLGVYLAGQAKTAIEAAQA